MKHSCTSLVYAMILICMVLISTSAETAVVTYTDRSSWEAAVGTFSEEDFNSYTVDTSFHEGYQVSFEPFDLYARYHGSTPAGNFIDVYPFLYSNDYNGTPYASMFTDNKSGADISVVLTSYNHEYTFSSWGADFYDAADGELLDLVLYLSPDWDYLTTLSVTTNTGFFGFTSDSELLDIVFVSRNEDSFIGESFGMDNVVWGGAPVPIPGAVWLLGSGLIGIMGIRRKFNK